jgi:hypothetical protein
MAERRKRWGRWALLFLAVAAEMLGRLAVTERAQSHSCVRLSASIIVVTTIDVPSACTAHDTLTHSCTTTTALGGTSVLCVDPPPVPTPEVRIVGGPPRASGTRHSRHPSAATGRGRLSRWR